MAVFCGFRRERPVKVVFFFTLLHLHSKRVIISLMETKQSRVQYERDFHAKRYAAMKSFALEKNVPISRVRLANGELSVISDEEYQRILNRVKTRNKEVKLRPEIALGKRPDNLAYDMWVRAKLRAKKIGVEFNIEPADVIIPDVCPVFGKPFNYESISNAWKPSLDRLDNEKGYVKGNVRVISWRANKVKNDSTLAEIEQLYQWLKAELKVVESS